MNTLDTSNPLEKTPIKYNKNYYVVQANELVRGRQDELTLLEAKLVRLAIAQVLKDDTDLKTYVCNVSSLAKFLGISSQNIYREVKDRKEKDRKEKDSLTDSLMRKLIKIKTERGSKTIHWVDTAFYEDGVITYKLSEELKPYLIGLNELFTRYGYEEILKLSTNYAIRLYELLYSYANMPFREGPTDFTIGAEHLEKGEIGFPVEYLREYFNCSDKYPNASDFIKRVIAPGIADINEKTLFPCTYRAIKEGKKITSIVFKVDDWGGEAGEMALNTLRNERYQAPGAADQHRQQLRPADQTGTP